MPFQLKTKLRFKNFKHKVERGKLRIEVENERVLTVRASFMVIGALAAAMVAEIDGGSADLWLRWNHQLRVGDGKLAQDSNRCKIWKQRQNPQTQRERKREKDLQRERERERGCDVFEL